MRFEETPLSGAFIVEIEPHSDDRGYFARTWCVREFEDRGLPSTFVQASLSHNRKRGTVRAMHMQHRPSREGKLVRCTRGRIFDAIVDLRPESRTYLQHFGVELDADAHKALYIPPTMLHGFQTLANDSEVFYQMTDFYAPELSFGVRWDDPAFGIAWPIDDGLIMNERDRTFPDFDRATYERQARIAAGRVA